MKLIIYLLFLSILLTTFSCISPGEDPTLKSGRTLGDVYEVTAEVETIDTLLLSWKAEGSGDKYIIAYRDGIIPPENCSIGTIINKDQISGTQYRLTGLTYGKLYSFRVCKAVSTSEVMSPGATLSLNLKVGNIGGTYQRIVKNGKYIYATKGSRGFDVFDVSDVNELRLVNSIDTDFDASKIYVHQNYLYLLSDGVYIYDINDPFRIELASRISSKFHDIQMIGNYLYALGSYSITVYSISNIRSPVFLKKYTGGSTNYCMSSTGGILKKINNTLVAQCSSSTYVYTTSGISITPRTRSVTSVVNDFAIYNNRIYQANSTGIKIYDSSNLSSIQGILPSGTNDYVSGAVTNLSISYPYLYAVTSNTLNVFDISDPDSIVPKGSLGITSLSNLEFENDYLYYTAGNNGVGIIQPISTGSIDTNAILNSSNTALDMVKNGNYIYTISTNRLDVFDISDENNPILKKSDQAIKGSTLQLINSNYLLVADSPSSTSSFSIVDIQNPTTPTLVPNANVPLTFIYSIKVIGTKLFVLANNTFYQFDVGGANITNPLLEISFNTTSSNTSNFEIRGDYLIFGYSNQIKVFQISTGTLVYSKATNPNATVQALINNALYVNSTGTKNVIIYDISTINNFTESKTLHNFQMGKTKKEGSFLYSHTSTELAIIDVSNESNPTITGGVASSSAFEVGPNRLYSGGLSIINITNKMRPLKTSISYGVSDGSYLYNSLSNYLNIYDFSNVGTYPLLSQTLLTDSNGYSNPIVDGNTLYIPKSKSLLIYDVTDRTNPIFLSSISCPSNYYLYRAEFYQSKIYANCGGRFTVIDVSDLNAPNIVYQSSTSYGNYYSLKAIGKDVYIQNTTLLYKYSYTLSPSDFTLVGTSSIDMGELLGTIEDYNNTGNNYLIGSRLNVDVTDFTNLQHYTTGTNSLGILCNNKLLSTNYYDVTNPTSSIQETVIRTSSSTLNYRIYGESCKSSYYGNYSSSYDLKNGNQLYREAYEDKISSINSSPAFFKVIADDNYTFTATSSGIYIYDSKTLDIKSLIKSEESINNIARSSDGNFLYATLSTSNKVIIYDISNPNSPIKEANEIPSSSSIVGLDVNGDVLTVLGQSNVDFYNIATPNSPVQTGTKVTSSTIASVINGTTFFLARNNYSIEIYDLSNLASPLATYTSPIPIYDIAFDNNYLFLAGFSSTTVGNVNILDVSDLSNPISISSIPIPSKSIQIISTESMLYIANGTNGGVDIYDISNPLSNFRVGGKSGGASSALDVAITSDKTGIVINNLGLQSYDLSDPSGPILISQGNNPKTAKCLEMNENYLFSCEDDGVIITDIRNLSFPKIINKIKTSAYVRDIKFRDNYLFTNEDTQGVGIYSFDSDMNETLINRVTLSGAISSFTVEDNFLFVTKGVTLYIYDISDVETPTLLVSKNTGATVTDLIAYNNYLYLISNGSNLKVYNVSNKSNPTGGSTYSVGYTSYGLTIYDNKLFVTHSGGYKIYDLSIDPVTLSAILTNKTNASISSPMSGYFYRAIFSENHIFYPRASNGFNIDDISNISSPVNKSIFSTMTYGVIVKENYLFAANDTVGITLFNIADKEFPYSSD